MGQYHLQVLPGLEVSDIVYHGPVPGPERKFQEDRIGAFDGQFVYLLCSADTCEIVDFRTDLDIGKFRMLCEEFPDFPQALIASREELVDLSLRRRNAAWR